MKGVLKECYVLIERLPEQMIKKSFVKVDELYGISSKETLKYDEIKIEDHDDLNDNIYKDNVSEVSFCINIDKRRHEITYLMLPNLTGMMIF